MEEGGTVGRVIGFGHGVDEIIVTAVVQGVSEDEQGWDPVVGEVGFIEEIYIWRE